MIVETTGTVCAKAWQTKIEVRARKIVVRTLRLTLTGFSPRKAESLQDDWLQASEISPLAAREWRPLILRPFGHPRFDLVLGAEYSAFRFCYSDIGFAFSKGDGSIGGCFVSGCHQNFVVFLDGIPSWLAESCGWTTEGTGGKHFSFAAVDEVLHVGWVFVAERCIHADNGIVCKQSNFHVLVGLRRSARNCYSFLL